jgi:hypothetical protein
VDEPNFLYDVAVAATGFLFSLALAVGIFFLQRRYSTKDRAEAELTEERAKAREDLLATVSRFAQITPRKGLGVFFSSLLAWRVLSFRTELVTAFRRSDDEELKAFCAHFSEGLQELTKVRRGIPIIQAWRQSLRVQILASYAEQALSDYLKNGGEIRLTAFRAAKDGRGGKSLDKLELTNDAVRDARGSRGGLELAGRGQVTTDED